jgi:hypothetical protein
VTKNIIGTGFGRGRTAFERLPDPVLVGLDDTQIGGMRIQPGTKRYRMGPCAILISPPYTMEDGYPFGWHLSIARQDRYPSWDEIAKARYALLPDVENMAMVLPPMHEFVNVHNFCFHLHELIHSAAGGQAGRQFVF